MITTATLKRLAAARTAVEEHDCDLAKRRVRGAGAMLLDELRKEDDATKAAVLDLVLASVDRIDDLHDFLVRATCDVVHADRSAEDPEVADAAAE